VYPRLKTAGLSYSGICFAICEALEKSSYGKRNNMQNSEHFGPLGSLLRVGFLMNAVSLADICLLTLWTSSYLRHSTNASHSYFIHLSPTLCNLSN